MYFVWIICPRFNCRVTVASLFIENCRESLELYFSSDIFLVKCSMHNICTDFGLNVLLNLAMCEKTHCTYIIFINTCLLRF